RNPRSHHLPDGAHRSRQGRAHQGPEAIRGRSESCQALMVEYRIMTRRALLPCAAMAARLAKATPHARVKSLQVISQQPEFYHGWPTLARLHSGELLVTYSGGREAHVCPFGRVEIIRSSDNGRSWSWPETVLDTPIDDRDSGVCETPAGSLLVTTFTSLAYEDALKKAAGWDPQRLARWRAVNLRAPAER